MTSQASRTFRIAVIPGDGIGNEVVPVGLQVLETLQAGGEGRFAFEFEWFPWGSQYYLEHGVMMAPDGLDRLRDFDAIYFGAVGWPEVPDHIALWGLRLAICQGFDQYACVRPVRLIEPRRAAGYVSASRRRMRRTRSLSSERLINWK